MNNWTYKWPEGHPKVGSFVQHTSQFLRNIGWYTNVPEKGTVVTVTEHYVYVHWDDDQEMGDANGRAISLANIKPTGAWEPN